MLLERSQHDLRPGVPHAGRAILSSADILWQSFVAATAETPFGCVVDDELERSRLGKEGPDLAVAPPGNDHAAIGREIHAIAGQVGDLDAEQLAPLGGVPYANGVRGAGDEYAGVSAREADARDGAKVACGTEHRVDRLGHRSLFHAIIDIGLARAAEEARQAPASS